jgi:acetyl-CoA synthetase
MGNKVNQENELYLPPPNIVENANIQEYEALYRQSLEGVVLEWFWDQVLDDSNPPFYKWFVGGQDQHRAQRAGPPRQDLAQEQAGADLGGRAGRQAHLLSYSPAPRGQQVRQRAAQHGRAQGRPGDHLHGRIPELPIAMLACAKIGAVHSVVYGGFSEQALADRIEDAQSRVLITSDGAWLRGKTVDLKKMADEAIAPLPRGRARHRGQAHRPGGLHGGRAATTGITT